MPKRIIAIRSMPEAEREAGVALRVDPDRLEDGRVHHPRAAQLEPAGLLARAAAGPAANAARDVELAARLDEREIARPQADLDVVAEEPLPDRSAGPLRSASEIPSSTTKASSWWNIGKVRRVEVLPIDPARTDHADRRGVRSIVRICTGEVCVRRRRPSLR